MRQVVLVGVFVEEGVLARKVVGHRALGPCQNLFHVFARPQPSAEFFFVEEKIIRPNQRRGQVNRIVQDGHVGHDISVPQKMLGHGGLIAFRKPVAASPALLDVRGVDGQNIAFPLAGGKSHEGMRRIVGRMRAAIHPDGARLLVGADVILDRNHLLGKRILFFPDPEMQRTMIDVWRDVYAALVFLQREARCVPGLCESARGVVNWKPSEIAQIGPRNALVIIFVMQRAPLARQLVLPPQRGESRSEQQRGARGSK